MNLIYFFIISILYCKPMNSIKYNSILLLLIYLSQNNNNNNCKSRNFNSHKVKDNTSNKKHNIFEDINTNDLITTNYKSSKTHPSLNTKDYTIDKTINNHKIIKNNTNNLNSDDIYESNNSNTKTYTNKKINNKKVTLKSSNKSTNVPNSIDINNLITPNDKSFKIFNSLDTSNNTIEESINEYNTDNLNSNDISDSNNTNSENYVNKKNTLKSPNKLDNIHKNAKANDLITSNCKSDNSSNISEYINMNYLIALNNKLLKLYNSLNNTNTTNDDNKKIKHNTNNSSPDCIKNSDIITEAYKNEETVSKISNLKSSNKFNNISEDVNTNDLINYNDKLFKSYNSLNTNDNNIKNIIDSDINHNTDGFSSSYKSNTTNKNKITSTIKHIDNSTYVNNCYIPSNGKSNDFNISEDASRTFKLPTLLIKCDISDSFKGNINFYNYIASINDVKNKLVITSNLLLLDISKRDRGTLFLDGYLETDIDYSVPLNFKVPLKCERSNFVFRSPLNISVPIELQYSVPGSENAFSDLDASLVKSSFTMKNDLCESFLLEDHISLYKKCEFTIIANYHIEVFKDEIFNY